MQRIIVVGTTGSGKTTLARQIAARLGYPHVEFDALHWESGWQEAPDPVFRERVAAALSSPCWTADGNYRAVRDIAWSRAETIVWLDYRFSVVFWRLLRRSVTRVFSREELWNGNREELRLLFSRESIMLWLFRSYWRRKREFPAQLQQPEYAHLRVIHLRSPRETARWLAALDPAPEALSAAEPTAEAGASLEPETQS
jgi:adenylate kinase family enzyme